jgi:hypothetical protein
MTDSRPCRYPGCKDRDGNPRSTRDGICIDVRKDGRDHGCQAKFRRDIRRLVLDWVQLHERLPAPMLTSGRKGGRRASARSREYGHPAEWASDTCDRIVAILNWTHDGLADALGQEPPPHPGSAEHVQVRAAWTFLTTHFADLCRQYWAHDTAVEIHELHNRIRASLGQTRPRMILPEPCPGCDHKTLVRTIDIRRDQIDCGNCGYVVPYDHYDFTAKLIETCTKSEPATVVQ